MAPRELRNLISQQLADLPTYIFPTVDFRMAEEDTTKTKRQEKQAGKGKQIHKTVRVLKSLVSWLYPEDLAWKEKGGGNM